MAAFCCVPAISANKGGTARYFLSPLMGARVFFIIRRFKMFITPRNWPRGAEH
jgi:hypothetical protein